MRRDQIAAIFVIDGPGMQAQGLLLAHSLRRHAGPDLALVGYVPKGTPPPAPDIAVLYARLGVTLAPLAVPAGSWAKPYPHGNKILACAAPRPSAATIFLDTDMVAVRPFDPAALFGDHTVAAVPEGKPTWGRDGDRWARVYGHFGLDLPVERVRLTRGRRRLFLPYYNAGFVAFRDVSGFAGHWLDTARRIDHEIAVAQKRPWLDQVALPVACRRFGHPMATLDAVWNYAISDRAPGVESAVMIHYHRFAHARAWPHFARAHAALAESLDLPAEVATALSAGLAEPVHG